MHCFSVLAQHLPYPSPLLLLCFAWGDVTGQGVSVGAGSALLSVSCAFLAGGPRIGSELSRGGAASSIIAERPTHSPLPSQCSWISDLDGALNKALVAAISTNVGCL